MSTSKSSRKRRRRETLRLALERAETNALVAEFAAMQPKSPHVDETRGIPAVDATHRAGKRRRGNSVTRKDPRDTTYVTRTVDIFVDGVCVEVGAKTLTYRQETP